MPKDEWAKARRKDAAKRALRSDWEANAWTDWEANAWKGKIRAAKVARREKARRNRTAGQTALYAVPAGTECLVRKRGSTVWRGHTTRITLLFGRSVRCEGYWYFFRHGEWELKVRVGQFTRQAAQESRGAVEGG